MATLLADLHTESFVLNLTIPVDHLPDLVNYHIEQLDPTTLVVDVRREQDINDLFRELTDHNLIVSSLRNKSNRLEQLFMRLLDEKKRPADSGSASEGWS
jgi:ABC-2 type transport system ATP-binding protein